ncbi:MAG: hypothetical protein AB1608_10245 [Thermoproteota archaeon]
MKTKRRLLFWLNGFFLHFSLAYYLQSHLVADFFGVIDINSKPKKFFQNQTLVNFNKTWFFHDHIQKTKQKPDLEYLVNFERKYKINLWKLALNERFFYLHNRFYKFKKEEILSILEQECKLFELVLNETKPDYFLTYDPVFHHQKLLLEICRAKGIRVLSVCATGIKNKYIIVENGETFDLDKNTFTRQFANKETKNVENDPYNLIFQKYLENRNTNFLNKFQALKDYLLDFDANDVNSNFMYYGRSKFNVVKDAVFLEIKRKRNYSFLQKHSSSSPNLNNLFVYFPMNINEEMNILHYAPFYTNQIEIIRYIAKSIPTIYQVYVKEHIAAGLRGWNDIDYYKEITDMPNVTLVNPHFDNDALIKNSQLVVTIRGTASLKAIKYGKPAIVFGEQPIQIIPSVFKVTSLDAIPELIKTALKHKVDPSDYEKYEALLSERTFEFNMFEFENDRDKTFFSGGILSNVLISDEDMIRFLDKNKNMLLNVVDAHLKIISN